LSFLFKAHRSGGIAPPHQILQKRLVARAIAEVTVPAQP
jgi:hypothetical protein